MCSTVYPAAISDTDLSQKLSPPFREKAVPKTTSEKFGQKRPVSGLQIYTYLFYVFFLSGLVWYIPGLSRLPTLTPPPSITCGTVHLVFDFFLHVFFSFHKVSSYQAPAQLSLAHHLSSSQQRSAVRCGVVPYGVVWYRAVPCGAVGCRGVPWGAVGCRVVPWGAVGCRGVP